MQLRDAKTSELLLDGTPLELALVARELGYAEVLFDGIGDTFDPDEVIRQHYDHVKGLQGASRERSLPDEERKRLAVAAKVAAAELELDATKVKTAARALEAARSRLEA